MKKILISLMIITLLILTGCEKEKKIDNLETISINDSGFGYSTTFKFPKKAGFVKTGEDDEGRSIEIDVMNNEENLKMQMYYTDVGETTYNDTLENDKTKKYYQEYNFNGYSTYAYSDYDTNLYLKIMIDNKNGVVTSLFVSFEHVDVSDIPVMELFEREVVQNFFNSI